MTTQDWITIFGLLTTLITTIGVTAIAIIRALKENTNNALAAHAVSAEQFNRLLTVQSATPVTAASPPAPLAGTGDGTAKATEVLLSKVSPDPGGPPAPTG